MNSVTVYLLHISELYIKTTCFPEGAYIKKYTWAQISTPLSAS